MQIPLVALRGLQFFLVLVITALVGNVIAEAFAGNPSSVNFAIFVAVFSWLAVLYGLVTAVLDKFAIPVASLALDGIATLLNFIAGVVLAAKLGVHSCGNKVSLPALRSISHANHTLGIRPRKQSHKRLQQPHEALPRTPSCYSFLLVPIRCLRCLAGSYVPQQPRVGWWGYSQRSDVPCLKVQLVSGPRFYTTARLLRTCLLV